MLNVVDFYYFFFATTLTQGCRRLPIKLKRFNVIMYNVNNVHFKENVYAK